MTDTELCAREGCGAPRAWHSNQSTLADLPRLLIAGHAYAVPDIRDGRCAGNNCACTGFTEGAPERKAYVVEIDERRIGLTPDTTQRVNLIPLAEYLASHPQPDGPMCVCRHKEDAHDGSGCLYRFCTCVGYNEVQP